MSVLRGRPPHGTPVVMIVAHRLAGMIGRSLRKRAQKLLFARRSFPASPPPKAGAGAMTPCAGPGLWSFAEPSQVLRLGKVMRPRHTLVVALQGECFSLPVPNPTLGGPR